MTTSPLILWCDLETTGSDEREDDILEAAFVITGPDLSVIAAYERVYRTTMDFLVLPPVVADMHHASGLWVATSIAERYATDEKAEQSILSWLGGYLGPDDTIALAGSGVSHFDRRFIRETWPALDERLTFWNHDVGCVRRLARLAGVEYPHPGPKAHRAMDDVLAHLEEARWYVRLLRAAQVPA